MDYTSIICQSNTKFPIDIGMTNIKVGGAPFIQIEFKSDNLAVDLTSLDQGYYRIYLKVDKYIFYDNLVIDKHCKY